MSNRERAAWAISLLLAVTAVGASVGWNAEHAARENDRQSFEANIKLIQSHAARGLQLEAEKAKHDAGGDSPPVEQ